MKAQGLVVLKNFFLCFSHDIPGAWPVWTPGHGWQDLLREPLYIVHTKWESSGPCGFGEDDLFFLCLSHCKPMGANGPRDGVIFDSRDMVSRIYKEDHYTLLLTKYERSRPYGLGEDFFFIIFP